MRFPPVCIIVLLILSGYAYAATDTVSAKVTLEIMNAPPYLAALALTPEQPTAYDAVACLAEVRDNEPETVVVEMGWYSGERFLSDEMYLVPVEFDVFGGDELTCEATAIDKEGVKSKTLSTSITLAESELREILIYHTGMLVGIEPELPILLPVVEGSAGMGTVTGFAVAEPAGTSSIAYLALLLIMLLVVNLFFLSKRLRTR